ncbi:MAG: PilZ domain-containing protein [Nitrospirae bacterium]|nr:PilZ domain-containing protein [Nitrospirota bacterium]
MIENKRAYKRFDLPLIVKFRPVPRSASYSLGLAKNLSCEGIGLEARNFNFMLKENLELELKLPQNAASVSLIGNVVWKRQDGKTSYAGIAFKIQDKIIHNETMEKITSYTSVPLVSAFHAGESDKEIEKSLEAKPSPKPHETQSLHSYDARTAEDVSSEKTRVSGLIKQYLDDEKKCKVSFLLPQEAAYDAAGITIVGDFNNWNINASPMVRDTNNDFRITLELSSGREYRFRYLIDGSRWENDWSADKYVPNAFGSDDSVVVV